MTQLLKPTFSMIIGERVGVLFSGVELVGIILFQILYEYTDFRNAYLRKDSSLALKSQSDDREARGTPSHRCRQYNVPFSEVRVPSKFQENIFFL